MNITTLVLVSLTLFALGVSFKKDKGKTITGLKIAKGRFIDMAGEIIGLLAIIGLFLAFIPPETIKDLLGGSNTIVSTLYGAAIGTIAIIPAFVAFPLSASLMDMGANLVSVAAFITTLTMVGFLTAPIEIEHFGKKFTLYRNALSFMVAIVVALGMGAIL